MCHPVVPSVRRRVAVVGGRLLVLRTVGTVTAQAATRAAAPAGGGGTGDSMKKCLCSPTRHPGSFRCRHHHAEYVWGGRRTQKQVQ